MTDMDDLPIVALPGSDAWKGAYDWGNALDATFPDQDGNDLAYACTYNGYGPLAEHRIKELRMLRQGEQDGRDWVWFVVVEDDDQYLKETMWIARGGCDYTGWDCQSDLRWIKVE